MGNRSDLPVAGDWDGDGTWDVGVRKASKQRLPAAQARRQVDPGPAGEGR